MNEILSTTREVHNHHDRYAIAVMKRLPGSLADSVVGHLPREISRYTYFIIIHGASVSCKVIDVNHRRSPLVQGGLEIPCEITVMMKFSRENACAMAEYTRIISDQYEEPRDGIFPDATQTILDSLKSSSDDEVDYETDEEV